jgi:hypothetical protein
VILGLLVAAALVLPTSATGPVPDATATAAATADGVELSYRWQAGETVPFERRDVLRQTLRATVDLGGGETESTFESATTRSTRGRFEVLAVADDGSARLRLHHDAFTVEAVTPEATVRWDSSEPTDDPAAAELGANLAPLLDHPITFVLAADGGVVSVEPAPVALPVLGRALDVAADQVAPGDEERLARALLQESFTRLPTGRLAPGDTWSESQTEPLPLVGGRLEGDVTFTVRDAETGPTGETLVPVEGAATYRYQAPGSSPALDALTARLGSVEVALDVTIPAAAGHLVFAPETGRPRSSLASLEVLLSLDATPRPGADPPGVDASVSLRLSSFTSIAFLPDGDRTPPPTD